ncbi:hypothetical protein WJX77_009650 [Trebouxia sp. C0004]
MTVRIKSVQSSQKVRKRKQPGTKEQFAAPPPVGGDDDDFAQIAVEEVYDQGEPDQQETEAAELLDSAQVLATAQAAQKPRKKKRRKGNAAYQDAQAAAAEVAQSNTEEQARWLWDSYRNAVGESFLEQEALTGESIVQLSGHGSLEEQVQAAVPDWQQAFCSTSGRSNGLPSCLLISPAALGAIAMIKSFPAFNKTCRIAKLFAKHIKVAEQQQYLQQHPLCVAAGTPNRLCKLADTEALQLSQLQLIVLDVQQDAKQRTILDMPETKRDFWAFFSRHVQQRLQTGLTKICLVNRSNN